MKLGLDRIIAPSADVAHPTGAQLVGWHKRKDYEIALYEDGLVVKKEAAKRPAYSWRPDGGAVCFLHNNPKLVLPGQPVPSATEAGYVNA